MVQCEDCRKAASGNCGKHLESYLGAVSFDRKPEELPKTTEQLIREEVSKAIAAEKEKWAAVAQALKLALPKGHVPCGCKRCFALNQALQKVMG